MITESPLLRLLLSMPIRREEKTSAQAHAVVLTAAHLQGILMHTRGESSKVPCTGCFERTGALSKECVRVKEVEGEAYMALGCCSNCVWSGLTDTCEHSK